MMRPMVMDYTDDIACRYLDQQYMLGDNLLCAPVFREDGVANFYLPEGKWTHLLSNEKREGGHWLRENYDFFSLPLFARENSIVAIGANNQQPDYDYGKKSAGSGPYILEEYAKGDHCSLVKNDKYWGGQKDEGEVTIDRVDFKIIPEAGSRIAALQTGEATVIYPMPTDQVATVRSAGDINMVSMPSTTMRYVTLNTNVKELSDVRVRQAMNYAFNQDGYVKVMYAGAATPATSVLPALVPGYKEQEPFAYDLDKAKSLLKEAGYEDGFEVEIIGDNSTQETKGMTFVMQQLKKVGIEVKVVPNEAATNAEIAAEPEDTTKIQMWYVNWSQSDADGFMRSLLSTAMTPPTGYNTAFWKNEEFDNELQLGNEGKTEDEQNQHYAKCQDIVWPECPWLYLASDNTLMSYKAYLTGIKYVAQGIDVTHAKLNA